ncbi:unnamed protein product [Rotaria sp. Silwood1]|nr:unnamed protein product [Rotaria sp. Silwood1]CAF1264129.1 unnamed protein product [Rotaria sp. Silwood1]CAF3457114.1 unnamed protein product [Rotaria sp. Silwood1]CAF3539552.1 unnamed protein product [Rotaria sp. Silwood1]CAF4638562.1 unnamed protein product [Rotaria sp. Silwood1]
MMPRPLDSVTPPISISIRFPFFGQLYNVIRVYSHGLILFGNITYTLPHSPPGPFPLRDFVCAAPYWADTDLTQDSSSNIFYREVTDENTLIQISNMIRNGFPHLSAHRMLWAFVATWDRVPGHQANPGRNTYQAIIATNGLYSFTMFLYNQLQWSAGAWGGYPQVGFNAGDEVNYFTLEKSFTADVVTVVEDSNVGVPGQFFFLANGNISGVQCNSSQGLQSSPFRGSMHGGYQLRLFGICFQESSSTVEINGNRINDCQLNAIYIICTMPMVSEGRLQIKVFDAERKLIGQTEFLSFMPESNADLIVSNHGELDNALFLLEDRRLTLHFLRNALTTNYLFRLVIYDYSTQYIIGNDTLYNVETKKVDIGLGLLNLSALNNLTINFQSVFPITGEPRDRVHLLDISFELILPNTTLPTVSWKGVREFIVRSFIASFSLVSSYCSAWTALQSDTNTRNLTNLAPTCPCRMRTTWDDEQFGFNTDSVCSARKSGMWNCRYHRGARGCYRMKSTRSEGGAHCCYDNGGIMITDRRRGGGSLKAHYPETLKALSTYRHFFSDLLPYYSCCGTSSEVLPNCQHYIRYRPSGTCVNLIPIQTGGKGDPHFSTLDGNSYTFNGHGEYTLLKSIDKQFEIQVRLAPLVNESVSPTSMNNATAIIAFVIRNEDQPRVQFELFPKLRLIEIRIDEKLLEFTPLSEQDELLSSSLIYNDDRQVIIRQSDVNKYSISYGESGIQFIVDVRPQFDFLDLISIIPSTFKEKRKFQGILGSFEGLTYPNGTNVTANLNDDQVMFSYAEIWRTTSTSSLFYYLLQDSHGQHQDLNYRPTFQQDLFRMYANTSRFEMAKNVCHNISREQQCIYDVLITNDPTVSQMHQTYETTIQALNEYVALVIIDIENDKSTSTENDETTSIEIDKTTSTANDKTTPTVNDKTTSMENDKTTSRENDQTTSTANDKTTPAENDKTTSKLENAAANYFGNEIWKVTLLALIAVLH